MYTNLREDACDIQFLFKGERYTRCLLTIPQGGVKNSYSLGRPAFNKESNSPQKLLP